MYLTESYSMYPEDLVQTCLGLVVAALDSVSSYELR